MASAAPATAAKAEAEDLPMAIVRRVVKEKLAQLSSEDTGDFTVHKDASLAFSESARIFIHYLSATANDICKDSKRQTINADDVFKALEEIEFSEFIEPLKVSLDAFRKKNAEKRSMGKEKARGDIRKTGEESVEKESTVEPMEEEPSKENEGPANDDDEDEDPSENEQIS